MTIEDNREFWQLFTERHPAIAAKLPARSFINGQIFCTKPAKISDEEYNIYDRYLNRWLMDKGEISIQPDMLYLHLTDEKNKTVRAIDTSTIQRITPITENSCEITVIEDSNALPEIIQIKQGAKEFRESVYIF